MFGLVAHKYKTRWCIYNRYYIIFLCTPFLCVNMWISGKYAVNTDTWHECIIDAAFIDHFITAFALNQMEGKERGRRKEDGLGINY